MAEIRDFGKGRTKEGSGAAKISKRTQFGRAPAEPCAAARRRFSDATALAGPYR